MPYFFSLQNLKPEIAITISGEEARHILLSHRVKVGESAKLQGPDGKRFLCEVISLTKKELIAKVLTQILVAEELPVEISLFLSFVSEKAIDTIFQKATELGAKKIYLFNSRHTAVKLVKDIFTKKHDRWNKILNESAKQSERGVSPQLEFLPSFKDVLVVLKKLDCVFLAEQSGSTIRTNVKIKTVGVVVGPEGGFTEEEINSLTELPNLSKIRLSPFVLRTETAAISALSVITSSFI